MAASWLDAQSNRHMNQMSGENRASPLPRDSISPLSTPTRASICGRPAEADIQRRFGVTPPTVHQMILTLERAGLIRRQPGTPRSIEVLVPAQNLPLLEMPPEPVKTSVPRY